jgi:hypothetical protein
MATEYDFTIKQGESLNATLILRTDDGALANMSGYNVTGHIIKNYCCEDNILQVLPLNILNPVESGYVQFFLSGEQTRLFPVTKLPYLIQRYGGNGVYETLTYGDFNVNP